MIAALEADRAGAKSPSPPAVAAAPAPAVADRPAGDDPFGAFALTDDPFAAADAALAADGFAGALPDAPHDPAADRARGALAEMFGLSPTEFAAREAADENAPGEADAPDDGGTGEPPVAVEEPTVEEPAAPEPVAERPDPGPVVETTGDEPEPAAELSPAAGEQVGDEVSDYMEALLARMRRGNPDPRPAPDPKPAAKPAPAPVVAAAPAAAGPAGDPAPAPAPPAGGDAAAEGG